MNIRTARLLLRPYRQEDLADFHEIFSDPAVMRYCGAPYGARASERQLAWFIAHPVALAAEEMAEGRMIGHLLFKQLPGETAGVYEIGWFFNRRYWRRGYAFEAARALMDEGFRSMGLHKIVAETIDPLASVRLMEKLGMRREGVFRLHARDPRGEWADVYWYAALRPDGAARPLDG